MFNFKINKLSMVCDWGYHQKDGQCVQYMLPPDIYTIIGTILICLISGLSSIAGLGGGGPMVVVLMIFFNYLPKNATIAVFVCILGATLGNTINQMRKSLNGQPLIQYHYAFISIPLMFTGSFIGVLINKYMPSLVICGIICFVSGTSLTKIYTRFREAYKKQSEENLLNKGTQIISQQRINPFDSERNIYVFKNVLMLISLAFTLLAIRGSERFPSVIGVKPCSLEYWILYFLSFAVTFAFSYRNIKILKIWMAPPTPDLSKHQALVQYHNPVQQHIWHIFKYSICAGIFSGFGLGGGVFLVPMYRQLGCTPLQATSSCAFNICVTAIINCLQGIFFGLISFETLIYLLTFSGGGSFILSFYISRELQRRNRLSLVEMLLFILLLNAIINIPLSLIKRYIASGYNYNIVLGFGSLC